MAGVSFMAGYSPAEAVSHPAIRDRQMHHDLTRPARACACLNNALSCLLATGVRCSLIWAADRATCWCVAASSGGFLAASDRGYCDAMAPTRSIPLWNAWRRGWKRSAAGGWLRIPTTWPTGAARARCTIPEGRQVFGERCATASSTWAADDLAALHLAQEAS